MRLCNHFDMLIIFVFLPEGPVLPPRLVIMKKNVFIAEFEAYQPC